MSGGFLACKGTVYPWQCDHVGHMNVMWYVGRFDEASWNLLARVGLTPGYLRAGARGMAAVEQAISYRRELLAGDIIEIRSRLLEVRDKAVRFMHEMFNGESGELAARCEIMAVHMDRSSRKACAFEPAIRDAMAEVMTEVMTDPAGPGVIHN